MSVDSLLINGFRNISNQTLTFDSKYNFILGDNGSGKSSLLESIFFLGHGKSFRSHKVDALCKQGESNFTISAKTFDTVNLGISKNFDNNTTLIKLNGEKLVKLSDLAKNIAVQIITPESFRLFFGGPKERRKFFDLGMFHVKHEFSFLWKEFSRVLKQRNACLKQRTETSTLAYWDSKFIDLSEQLTLLRSEYVTGFIKELKVWLDILLPNIGDDISIDFYKGWSKSRTLVEVIKQNTHRELQQGHTLNGAHKFDLKFFINGESLESRISRGQQKLFLLALTFTQAKLIERVERVKPILLIDDIGAELDEVSRSKLYQAIEKLDCQVIITAIDKMALEPLVPNNKKYKVFHVEHGYISEVNRLSYDSRK